MILRKDYDLEGAFAAIEDELINSMMRNMKRHTLEEINEDKQWEMWQALQLKSLEQYKQKNKSDFEKWFSSINVQIEKLIKEANQNGQMEQEIKILEAIRNGFRGYKRASNTMQAEFFKLNERKLETLIKATTDDLKKAEHAILRRANDQYRKAIFNAQVYANTGAGTYEKAVDMATKDMLSAGLNCVEYTNGARHTLKDYADMAIRTASKRAYLQGEGVMRQTWGISTVIVNKRGNPCPKCLPFCGKVLIDDVWSGGSRQDGPYPLMSSAIAAGLYHPRCKDSHTTYFEGISTPPDDKYTNAEIQQIEDDYRLEQKKMYAKKQAEKYGRLARHSLDKDDKKRYRTKQKQWENKIYDVNMLRTYEDPIREKIGSAFESHYEETLKIIKELEAKGIEIEYRDNVMGYQPNPTHGKVGRFVIDRRASYSAWLHERQHVIDDENSGWKGFRNFMNLETAVKFEDNAYDIEIAFAEELGYNDVVKRLKVLKLKRRKELLGNDNN